VLGVFGVIKMNEERWNRLNVIAAWVGAIVACISAFFACVALVFAYQANGIAADANTKSDTANDIANKGLNESKASVEAAKDSTKKAQEAAQRADAIAKESNKIFKDERELLKQERRHSALVQFQAALDEAESRYECCRSCEQDVFIAVPLERAKKLAEDLAGLDYQLSSIELFKLTALGCSVWDFSDLELYCEKCCAVAKQTNRKLDSHHAYLTLGHAHFRHCRNEESGATVDEARAAFEKAAEALMDSRTEPYRRQLARFYCFWAHHEMCYAYFPYYHGSATRPPETTPEADRIVSLAEEIIADVERCPSCGILPEVLDKRLADGRAGDGPQLPCWYLSKKTAAVQGLYTQPPSFGKLFVHNVTHRAHHMLIDGMPFIVTPGRHSLWIPLDDVYLEVRPNGPMQMWRKYSWRWMGDRFELHLGVFDKDGELKISETPPRPNSTYQPMTPLSAPEEAPLPPRARHESESSPGAHPTLAPPSPELESP